MRAQALAALLEEAELLLADPAAGAAVGRRLFEIGSAVSAEQPDLAVALYQSAATLHPDLIEAHHAAGMIRLRQGDSVPAAAFFTKVITQRPDYTPAWYNLGAVAYDACDYPTAAEAFARAAVTPQLRLRALGYAVLSELHSGASDWARCRVAAAAWAEALAPLIAPAPPPPIQADDKPAIAFLCRLPSLDGYAMILAPLATRLRRWFEVRLLTLDDTPHTTLSDAFDRIDLLGPGPDAARAARLRAVPDRPALLINCDLPGVGLEAEFFTARPVAHMVDWAHGVVDLGLFDATLVHDGMVPPEQRCNWRQTALTLPIASMSYGPPPDAPSLSAPLSVQDGRLRLGCFNRADKITAAAAAAWAQIMAARPTAELYLVGHSYGDPDKRARVIGLLTEAGVDPARLRLRGELSRAEFLGAMGEVDLALEPFPFSGGLTCFETLWQGTPTVSLAADHPFGRVATMILTACGLDSWTATTIDAYVATATALLDDAAGRAAFRREARARLAASPFMDHDRFAADVAAALQRVLATPLPA